MARTWIAVTVELVSGIGDYYWPRPGRTLLAKRSTTFRDLARAIDAAFGRWDLAHLHRFSLSDGSEVVPLEWWDETTGDELDDASTTLARLRAGETFAYEFDLGDAWEHVCTVEPERVDPEDVYGTVPPGPVVIDSWGTVPDQYGRRWRDDEGEAEPPPQPDPPAGDLPPLMYSWGAPGAWEASGRAAPAAGQPFDWEPREWDDTSWRALRGAVYRGDAEAVVEALRQRDPVEPAHLAGDGVLLALEEGDGEVVSYARVLIRRLSERQGPGDAALADDLRIAMGQTDAAPREPFPIDLDQLAAELYSGDSLNGWRIDRETARWWPDDPEDAIGEPPPPHWDDEDRWIYIDSLGPEAQREDMDDFISTVDDPRRAEALRAALDGRGGFRHFRSVVTRDEEVGRRVAALRGRSSPRPCARVARRPRLPAGAVDWAKSGVRPTDTRFCRLTCDNASERQSAAAAGPPLQGGGQAFDSPRVHSQPKCG